MRRVGWRLGRGGGRVALEMQERLLPAAEVEEGAEEREDGDAAEGYAGYGAFGEVGA